MKRPQSKFRVLAEVEERVCNLPYRWSLPAQYALAIAIVTLALLFREGLEPHLEGRIPFSITLGALLVLVLLVRPGPFFSAAIIGWWASIYYFLPPQKSFFLLDEPGEIAAWFVGLTLILAAITAVFIRNAHNKREVALTESEKRYRTLFNSIDEGFCIIHLLYDNGKPQDFKFLECNPAFETHSGIKNAEGKTAYELVPELEESWLNVFSKVHLSGESVRFEEHTNKVGDKWFNVFAFRIGAPEDCRVAVLFSDITEERRGKESLRQSEERYRMVNLATNDAIYDWKVRTGELTWNQAIKDVFGYEPEDVEPTIQWWTEHLHPEDRDRVTGSLNISVESDHSLWRESYRFRRADGTYAIVSDRGYIGRDREGHTVRMIGSMRDETERLAAERALRKSEELFQEMVDHAPVIVWLTDAEGSTTFLSKSWYELTGQEHNRGLNFGWLKRVHPQDRERARQVLCSSVKLRKAYKSEYRTLNNRGSYSWVIDIGKPRFDQNGEYLGFIGSVTDISETKELEEVLREADKKKDQFLAILAHELRNPLAAIRMASTVLRKEKSQSARVNKMGEVIERQSGQLSQLIDDLLDVSRITRGKVSLHKEYLPIRSAVESSIDGVKEACRQKGLNLSLEIPDEPLFVHADSVRISQVISNLLTNSCKFTEEGEVSLQVEKKGGAVVMRVKDTGVGIAQEDLEHIFEMFTQVQRDRHAGGGLGIGLALSRSIIQLHGGTIEAISAGPGTGSEFIVKLPLAKTSEVMQKLEGEYDQEKLEKGVDSSTRRILIVDDNLDALEATGVVLRMSGHELKLAQDGPRALDIAERFLPEVVLLDIGMPGMDGYEVARKVREAPWGKDMLLIAMTGFGHEKDKEKARKAGFDAHLTKPVDPDELSRILRGSIPSFGGRNSHPARTN